MSGNIEKRLLSVIGALLLVIGFAAGAVTMAIVRPSVRIEQAAGQVPVAVQIAQPERHFEPQPKPEARPRGAQHKGQPILADTKDVPAELVAFIRERLEKNTNSGQWEEIQWEHRVGKVPDERLSDLYLPIAVDGHAAALRFRSFNGAIWSQGWIAAAQYAPDHLDWCGQFDGSTFRPKFSIPSEKPVSSNPPVDRAVEILDEILDQRLPPGPPPGMQVPKSSPRTKR